MLRTIAVDTSLSRTGENAADLSRPGTNRNSGRWA
jgi:hypothetical protein